MGASITGVSAAVMRRGLDEAASGTVMGASITGVSQIVMKRGLDVEAFKNSDWGLNHRGSQQQ